jgi:methionyl-tRNA synthetase
MYVERMGAQIGMSGEEAADHFVASIRETLDAAGTNMTVFMDPRTSPHFRPLVINLFDRLWTTGKIELREAPAPYCEGCSRYLFEADIAGECPHCGTGMTGNTCEDCGGVNDCINLIAPRCTACQQTPVERPYTRLIFPLSQWTEQLRVYHRCVTMNPHLRSFCERTLAHGLQDVAITHPSGWGIPVPTAEAEDEGSSRPSHPALAEQTLYVWFEMAARYFAYASHINERTGGEAGYDSFWRAEDAEVVQFFGFDNSFYYSILLPAFYMAYDAELRLPTAFVINEFYRLDGEKFSTSRDHRILGRDMAAAVPRDVMRFYLAHSCPEQEETNFTSQAFADTLDRELRQRWRPWLSALSVRVAGEYEGLVPSTGDWTADQRHFFDRLCAFVRDAEAAYAPATFSPQRLTRLCGELVRLAQRFAAGEVHWIGVPDREQERRTSVALELLAAKTLAFVVAPVMPSFGADLWESLGLSTSVTVGSWESTPSWVPA